MDDPGGGLNDLGRRRFEPVLADVDSRYFDGARLNTPQDGAAAYDNLAHLASYLKSRAGNGDAFVDALVGSMTSVRMLADAAIQDATATIGPFRTIVPAPGPAPPGLAEAFADLDSAMRWQSKSDDQLFKANPEPATRHASKAYDDARNVLTRLGVTYTGDSDGDGLTNDVELRFGASPLLVDSDGDGLTDKTEITQLTGLAMPNNPDSDGDGVRDGDEDVDGDGLSNLQEQDLGTKLTEADTDGDGLADGAEVARGTNPLVPDQPARDPIGGSAPPIEPAPTDVDTDGDGLGDLEEGEVETDPANVDTDGDGLSDGAEYNELNISPLTADTDGDGLSDSYEIEHAEDQGTDPATFDEQVSKWTYVTDFLLGLVAGDFDQRDSLAWLAGNLCSAGLGFIPIFGTILGLLTDIRDAIASAIHGDWVSAGIAIVGIVPVVGDALEIVGKVVRFLLKYPKRILKALVMVAKNSDIPDDIRKAVLKAVLAGDYDNIISSGLSADFMLLLAKSGQTDLKILEDAVSAMSKAQAVARGAGHLPGKNEAEAWLAEQMQRLGRPGVPKPKIDTPNNPKPRSYREPDYYEELPDGSHVIHEMKFGTPYFDPLKQCRQDGKLKRDRGVPGHVISNVVWHFVPRSRSYRGKDYHSLGPTQELLACLQEEDIPFVIYPH